MNEYDDVFDALANGRRRELLLDLADGEPQRVPELSGSTAELATAHEAFLEECVSGATDFPGVNTQLLRTYRVHLPKLSDYGFIEWDSETKLVWRGARFEEVTPMLEWLAAQEADRSVPDLEA